MLKTQLDSQRHLSDTIITLGYTWAFTLPQSTKQHKPEGEHLQGKALIHLKYLIKFNNLIDL
ncbi:hypothetical protein [Serratia symbiotica]|uniref:hypothetical protein n=1 Tax=Serratia symbiotica TaxID=138074 RepID=UPI0030D0CEE9